MRTPLPLRGRRERECYNGRDCETAWRVRNHAAQSLGLHTASDLRSVVANVGAVPVLLRRSAQPPGLVPFGTDQGTHFQWAAISL